jgi:hypothetical protein
VAKCATRLKPTISAAVNVASVAPVVGAINAPAGFDFGDLGSLLLD